MPHYDRLEGYCQGFRDDVTLKLMTQGDSKNRSKNWSALRPF